MWVLGLRTQVLCGRQEALYRLSHLPRFHVLFVCFSFDTGSHYVAQCYLNSQFSASAFRIFWNYRHAPLCQAQKCICRKCSLAWVRHSVCWVCPCSFLWLFSFLFTFQWLSLLFVWYCWEGFHSVAQAALEFIAFCFSQPQECWNNKPKPPCPAPWSISGAQLTECED